LSIKKRGMDRIMLEVVVSGCVTTPQDIFKFVRCTLLSAEHTFAGPSSPTAVPVGGPAARDAAAWQQGVASGCKQSLRKLGEQGFIEWVQQAECPGRFQPCKLGHAAVAAGLEPGAALMLNEDVQMLARAVNLESDLHLMLLVAPVAPTDYVDWMHVARTLREAYTQRANVREVCRLSGIRLHVADKLAARQARGWRPEVCFLCFLPGSASCECTCRSALVCQN
jgi:hypothetical protein